jgi:hypothetical protein
MPRHPFIGSEGEPVTAASWLSGRRWKTKGWGSRVREGEGRAGPSRPGGQGPRGVRGSGLAEGQGPGGWAENLRWAQFKK